MWATFLEPSMCLAEFTMLPCIQAHNGMEQLKANMREEHVLKLDWISSMFNLVRAFSALPRHSCLMAMTFQV